MAIKDMEMPARAQEESAEEEFDFGFDEEMEGEDSEAPDLSTLSDDDLIAEMKKRGFEVEDEVEEAGEAPEEMPAEEDMEAPAV